MQAICYEPLVMEVFALDPAIHMQGFQIPFFILQCFAPLKLQPSVKSTFDLDSFSTLVMVAF